MPNSDTILWTAISALILIMLGIIGYLIRTGFDSLKDQLKTFWEKIATHQKAAEANALEIAAMKARCEERHNNG